MDSTGQRNTFAEHFGWRVDYDGFLTSGKGGRCSQMTDVGPLYVVIAQCFGPTPEDQGKVIVVQTETDPFQFRGGTVRAETSTYRIYEYAGISHIPTPFWSLAAEFPNATRQNPVDMAPAYRAAIANLASWVVDGVEPPGSVWLEGTIGADFRVTVARDADGNALGGVRMPHMPRVINGKPAGAPLGEYNGIEPRFPLEAFVVLGGYFEPFSSAELQARYGTRGEYVSRVERSAKELLESRFILREDYAQYVVDAAHQPL